MGAPQVSGQTFDQSLNKSDQVLFTSIALQDHVQINAVRLSFGDGYKGIQGLLLEESNYDLCDVGLSTNTGITYSLRLENREQYTYAQANLGTGEFQITYLPNANTALPIAVFGNNRIGLGYSGQDVTFGLNTVSRINMDGSASFAQGAAGFDSSGNIFANNFNGTYVGLFQSLAYDGGNGSGTQIDNYGNFQFGSGFSSGNEWDVYGATWTGFRISGFRSTADQSAALVVNPFIGNGAAFTSNNVLDDGSGNATLAGSASFAGGAAGFDSLGNLHATNFTGGGGGGNSVTLSKSIALSIALS